MNALLDFPPEGMTPAQAGAHAAQQLGSHPRRNPYKPETEESQQWLEAWEAATSRIVDLFESWLALGHSVPLLSMGQAGQALGPMVAGLIQTNGNATGPLLVGALWAHDGQKLAEILPDRDLGRDCYEATQYAILGAELPEELQSDETASKFYRDALMIEAFKTEIKGAEIREEGGRKVARTSFDLAEFLKFLVQGPPETP